jgi:hypothetical protein
MGDGRPKSSIEGRAEAIGARTGIFVHSGESSFDLVQREGSGNPSRQGTGVRVEGRDIKIPGDRGDSPKEGRIVGVEDSGFSGVVRGLRPVHREERDGVASEPAGGGSVEKFGVLITFKGIAHLSSCPPVEGIFLNRQVESIHSKGTQEFLRVGEEAPLFQEVDQVNKETTVLFSLGAGETR